MADHSSSDHKDSGAPTGRLLPATGLLAELGASIPLVAAPMPAGPAPQVWSWQPQRPEGSGSWQADTRSRINSPVR
jgi:hypothetical protein